MKNSKLIKLLKSLSPEEFKPFYKFIRSPFSTSSKDLLKLFDYLRKYYPNFSEHLIEKERIFKLLFPGQTYSDIKLRNLMRKLSRLVEDYLLYLETDKNDFIRNMRLKEIYGKRNIYDLFEKSSKDLIEKVEEQAYRGADYYKNLYLLNQDFYFHPQTKKQGDAANFIKAALENLIHNFAITQSRLVCELKSREVMFSEENNFNKIEFKELNLGENRLFHLLQQVMDILETNDIKAYKKVKENFISSIPNLNHDEGRYLLLFLRNYAIRQSSKQEIQFFKDREIKDHNMIEIASCLEYEF